MPYTLSFYFENKYEICIVLVLREINDFDFDYLQGVHGEEVALGAEQTFHRSSTRGATRGYWHCLPPHRGHAHQQLIDTWGKEYISNIEYNPLIIPSLKLPWILGLQFRGPQVEVRIVLWVAIKLSVWVLYVSRLAFHLCWVSILICFLYFTSLMAPHTVLNVPVPGKEFVCVRGGQINNQRKWSAQPKGNKLGKEWGLKQLHILSWFILQVSCKQCFGSDGSVIIWRPGSGSVNLNHESGSVRNIRFKEISENS